MFNPTILALLQLLSAHQGGISREGMCHRFNMTPPEWVERVLEWALKAGLVEERGTLLTPLPPLLPLMRKLEALAAEVNRQTLERQQVGEQTMELVRMLLRGDYFNPK